MPDTLLHELAENIRKGLGAESFNAKEALTKVLEERFGKNIVSKTGIRDAYGVANGDKGVAFAGLTNVTSQPSGAYGGASLAWFPTGEHGSLITFVVGTAGLSPDEGILTRPGHRRRIAALRRSLSRRHVEVWTKPDPSALGVKVPNSVQSRFHEFEHVFNRYGSEMYCVAKVPDDSAKCHEVVRSFLDLYALERGWNPLVKWRDEFEDFRGQLLEDVFHSVNAEDVNTLLRNRRFVVLQGPPGTGKTRLAEKVRREHFGGNGMTVQFHPAVAYEDFLIGLAPEPHEGSLKFGVRKGWLLQASELARESPCVLIIDEVNRADLGKVLGEAIYLFESGEVGGDSPRSVRLPHSLDSANGSSQDFSLPPNLYVIATMNTADRSIASMDLAVRRRFAFVTMMPDRAVVAAQGLKLATDVFDRLVNIFVEHAPDDALDLLPGHAYFLANDEAQLRARLRYDLIPLLNEYLRQNLLGRATTDLYAVRDEIEDKLAENTKS